MRTRMRKARLPVTVEFLRSLAAREAHGIGRFGWRPSKADVALLKRCARDAQAFRTLARAWRSAGFKVAAIMRLAGRFPPPTTTASTAIAETTNTPPRELWS
jgi:hypothetical protein